MLFQENDGAAWFWAGQIWQPVCSALRALGVFRRNHHPPRCTYFELALCSVDEEFRINAGPLFGRDLHEIFQLLQRHDVRIYNPRLTVEYLIALIPGIPAISDSGIIPTPDRAAGHCEFRRYWTAKRRACV